MGGGEGGISMTNNPLSVQAAALQDDINRKNQRINDEELKQKEEQSQERQDLITNLKTDRDGLRTKLNTLQKSLEEQQQNQLARKPVRRTADSLGSPESVPLTARQTTKNKKP